MFPIRDHVRSMLMTGVTPLPAVMKRGRAGTPSGTMKSPCGSPIGRYEPTARRRTRWPDKRPPSSTLTVMVMHPSRRSGDEEIE